LVVVVLVVLAVVAQYNNRRHYCTVVLVTFVSKFHVTCDISGGHNTASSWRVCEWIGTMLRYTSMLDVQWNAARTLPQLSAVFNKPHCMFLMCRSCHIGWVHVSLTKKI